MTDAQGLKRAYEEPDSVFQNGDTLYIAGTHPTNIVDWYQDVTLIPTKRVRFSNRFRQAEEAMNKGIKRVVGHSLGGSVALELQQNDPDLESVTYGAPVWSSKHGKRYRHWLDPVSMFDSGASSSSSPGWNPHSYDGF